MDLEKSDNSSFEDLTNIKDVRTISDTPPSDPSLHSEITDSQTNFNTEPSSSEEKSSEEEVAGEAHERSEQNSIEDEDVTDILGNGQLTKRILVKSNVDQRPGRGELVTISFTGKLDDGTIVDKQEKFQCHVGDFEIVQGLDMAVPLMNIGEVAEVKVSPRFAYGSLGFKNDENPEQVVPANAHLTFEIHLIDSVNEDFKDLKQYEIRRRYGIKKKERANFWYNRKEYAIAVQLYRRALDYLDDRDGDPDYDKDELGYSNSDLQRLLEDRMIVYNNLAMAQIKMSAFDAALKSVEHVLHCQPLNAKALYRKGRILEAKGDTKGAITLLQKAATLEKDNRVIHQDLAKLMIKQRREENNEKEMYQKMLGQAKKLEQKTRTPKKEQNDDTSRLRVVCYLLGTVLVGVAGAAIYRYKY